MERKNPPLLLLVYVKFKCDCVGRVQTCLIYPAEKHLRAHTATGPVALHNRALGRQPNRMQSDSLGLLVSRSSSGTRRKKSCQKSCMRQRISVYLKLIILIMKKRQRLSGWQMVFSLPTFPTIHFKCFGYLPLLTVAKKKRKTN